MSCWIGQTWFFGVKIKVRWWRFLPLPKRHVYHNQRLKYQTPQKTLPIRHTVDVSAIPPFTTDLGLYVFNKHTYGVLDRESSVTYSPQTNTCLATNCRGGFCQKGSRNRVIFFPRKSRRTFCSNGWGPGQGPFMVVVFLGLIFEQCKGWQIFLHNVLIYIWTKTDFAKDVGLPSNWGCWYPKITTSIVFFFGGEGWQGHVVFSFLQASCWLPQKIDCQLLFPSVYFLQNRHIEITWPTMLPNWSWSFSIVCDEFDTSTTCQRSINWHLVSFFHLQLSWYFSKNPTVQPMKCLEASTFL